MRRLYRAEDNPSIVEATKQLADARHPAGVCSVVIAVAFVFEITLSHLQRQSIRACI